MKIPTAPTAVTTEQPTLIHLLLRRKSKNLFHVKMFSSGSCVDGDVDVEEACRRAGFDVCVVETLNVAGLEDVGIEEAYREEGLVLCAFASSAVMEGRLLWFARCSVGLAVLKNATVALTGEGIVRGVGLNDRKQAVLVQVSVVMLGGCVVIVMLNAAASPHSRLRLKLRRRPAWHARAIALTRHVNADTGPLQALSTTYEPAPEIHHGTRQSV